MSGKVYATVWPILEIWSLKMETILLVASKLIVHRKFMTFENGTLSYFVYLLQFYLYEKQLAISF